MDVQTYFFRRKNINAAGNARSWTDHLLWHHAAHTIDLFQYQAGETISDCYAVQGPIHPQLGIAMDMGIVAKVPSGAILTLSLSFNNDGPLGSFFRYICDNGTYKAFYDDLSDGKDNKIDVSKVDVSMDGIELEDREFIAAIKEKRAPNAQPRAGAALHARPRQARADHRPAAQGARLERRHHDCDRSARRRIRTVLRRLGMVRALVAQSAKSVFCAMTRGRFRYRLPPKNHPGEETSCCVRSELRWRRARWRPPAPLPRTRRKSAWCCPSPAASRPSASRCRPGPSSTWTSTVPPSPARRSSSSSRTMPAFPTTPSGWRRS